VSQVERVGNAGADIMVVDSQVEVAQLASQASALAEAAASQQATQMASLAELVAAAVAAAMQPLTQVVQNMQVANDYAAHGGSHRTEWYPSACSRKACSSCRDSTPLP
jgi:hypothetical protein